MLQFYSILDLTWLYITIIIGIHNNKFLDGDVDDGVVNGAKFNQ